MILSNPRMIQKTEMNPNLSESLLTCQSLIHGRGIHSSITCLGLDQDRYLRNTLLIMYSRCHGFEDARHTFGTMQSMNIISCNVMISSFVQYGHPEDAVNLFEHIQNEGIIQPDKVTFLGITKACSALSDIGRGILIHASIICYGYGNDVVLMTSLIHMYGKCGDTRSARRVFDNMKGMGRDLISWNAMMGVYNDSEEGKETLKLFGELKLEALEPNRVSFIHALGGCSSLESGRCIHQCIAHKNYELTFDLVVGTELISMYSRCGSLNHAWLVFDHLPSHDVISWSTMIAACAQHGTGKEALQLIDQMFKEGFEPNEITFISILNACSHAGYVKKGCSFFLSMITSYHILPTMKHYGCLIDLFGRSGRIDHAADVIDTVPFPATALLWETLLASCRVYGDLIHGQLAAESVIRLTPERASPYVLLSNIYAEKGQWDEVEKIRNMMIERGVRKEPGLEQNRYRRNHT